MGGRLGCVADICEPFLSRCEVVEAVERIFVSLFYLGARSLRL